jgi:hypothetical protein
LLVVDASPEWRSVEATFVLLYVRERSRRPVLRERESGREARVMAAA